MSEIDEGLAIETVKVALRRWDPIGVIDSLEAEGLPPDEYDSYARPLWLEVHSGASSKKIAKHLAWIRSSSMSLGTSMPSELEEEIGEKLEAWRKSGYSGTPDFRFTRYAL